jgi:hypothetical protein
MISLNSNTLVPSFERSESVNDKVREWATLLIAGRLTGDHLRRVADDDQMVNLVACGEIGQALADACEELRPNVTLEDSLRFDLAAVLRKLDRIIAEL